MSAIEQKITKCKTQRSVIIGQIERVKKFCDDRLENASTAELEMRLEGLVEYFDQFNKIQCNIELLDEEESKKDVRAEVEDLYYIIRPIILEALKRLRTKINGDMPINNHSTVVKLPKIEIPKFSGDISKWSEFYEMFTSLIHNNKSLDDLARLHYLKNSISHEAARTIESLEIIPQNYTAALRLLTERYSNQKLICFDHIQKIFSFKPIDKPDSSRLRELIDNTNSNLRALASLGRPTANWDDLIVYIVCSKLDTETKMKWNEESSSEHMSTLEEILKFLNKRCQAIESKFNSMGLNQVPHSKPNTRFRSALFVADSPRYKCYFCLKPGHSIYRCTTFLSLPPEERFEEIKQKKNCINCLSGSHSTQDCPISDRCRKCSQKHHTLLHHGGLIKSLLHEIRDSQPTTPPKTEILWQTINNKTTLNCTNSNNSHYVFLSTALIEVLNSQGIAVPCRALLDSASQINVVTSELVKRLNLTKIQCQIPITGIGNEEVSCQSKSTIQIQSRVTGFATKLEAYVLPQITGKQPHQYVEIEQWPIPKNIKLADPNFNVPQKIDLLIGAELFYNLLAIGQIKLNDHLPTLQNTLLGWVVSGNAADIGNKYSCHLVTKDPWKSLETQIERFWNLETSEIKASTLTPQEALCEEHFKNHSSRDNEGRFIVKLPFKMSPESLGNSRAMATRRFHNLEKRLSKNSELKKAYTEFINEYKDLGHMHLVNEDDIPEVNYFLPHHCVIKPTSSSTKLRVVFDASAKTTTGVSLNDILLVGPVVQNELFTIMIRFRAHKFVFSADISKMYRQIKVQDSHTRFQYILWREQINDEIKVYKLNTVTYGLASAPYLATRCLKQLALDGKEQLPLASDVLEKDMYVDDLLTGSNCLQNLLQIKSQVIEMLGMGGMTLRKWCSNSSELLENIPKENRETLLQIDESELIKTLGMYWQPFSDQFHFHVNLQNSANFTKRGVISDIARIFDHLGLLAPVITLGKLFLQQLWTLKMDWDQSLPQQIFTEWKLYRTELLQLNSLHIQRHLFTSELPSKIELHGFADASEKAYGAAIYTRSLDVAGKFTTSLLCAKSRVAPLKNKSLPRLELCAAVLLATLMKRVSTEVNFNVDGIYYWSDSMIVLSWIRAPSASWKTFVANRVASIQEFSSVNNWNHVESKSNPADIISRGLAPRDICNSTLWFEGPKFLHTNQDCWQNNNPIAEDELPERRKPAHVFLVSHQKYDDLIENVKHKNCIRSTQNIFAYVYRFIYNTRYHSANKNKITGPLTVAERKKGLQAIVKNVQLVSFEEEIKTLLSSKNLSQKSRLKSLFPFLDDDNILRVGGRLRNSMLPYTVKHPILLPSNHPFTLTLLSDYHCRYMHIGPQALLAAVRQKFWPINGRRLSTKVYRSCIRCFRARPMQRDQLMGELPTERITRCHTFENVAVDYCGPFYIHFKVRGKRPAKAYLAIFICLATKACHLELVSDLTTDTFIGALKRFIATRGLCSNIFSDNGTNFIGANSVLHELYQLFNSQTHCDEVRKICMEDNITWHFQPPSAPHFGGLHESAVKSAKFHLRRVVGNASLTFEELTTTVKQVEAILNSRPLTPLSTNPDDFEALTPGHFIIGRPLKAIIEPDVQAEKISLTNRWRLIQQLQQHFWTRWSREYLCELQHRRKWNKITKSLSIGDLVLIKDENLPPLKWKLARVVDTHPGADGLVRVASVKTSTGTLKRATSKLCPLPQNDDNQLKNIPLQGGENI